jgi:uncharacterized membrane protein YdjX (TVP38/TMEM64 family)
VTEAPQRRRSRKLDVLRVIVFILLAGAAAAWLRGSGLLEYLEPEGLRARVDALGWWAIGFYFLAWILLVVLLSQTLLPTIAGGVMFGWLLGGILAVLGAALGASVQFWLARTVLKGPAESLIFRRLPQVREALEERGLALLILLRFVWAPSWAVNLGAGLTRLPYRTFAMAFPALLPGAVLITLLSDSLLVYGWRDIPPIRWGSMAAIVTGGIGVYLWAVRRWPELKLSFSKPDGS